MQLKSTLDAMVCCIENGDGSVDKNFAKHHYTTTVKDLHEKQV